MLEIGSSVCNPMSLISFFPTLSAVCSSLYFCTFWQEASELFQIGACNKPLGLVSRDFPPVQGGNSWKLGPTWLEAAAVPLGCAVALALAYPPPRFIFDPQGTLKCYRYKQAFQKLQKMGKEKNSHNVYVSQA